MKISLDYHSSRKRHRLTLSVRPAFDNAALNQRVRDELQKPCHKSDRHKKWTVQKWEI